MLAGDGAWQLDLGRRLAQADGDDVSPADTSSAAWTRTTSVISIYGREGTGRLRPKCITIVVHASTLRKLFLLVNLLHESEDARAARPLPHETRAPLRAE